MSIPRIRTVQVITAGPQGPAGPAGPAGAPGARGAPGGGTIDLTAATALGGHRVVALNSDGQAIYADAGIPDHAFRVVGLTSNATGPGAPVEVTTAGKVTEPTWSWDTSLPVYLGENGLLTQTPPASPLKFSMVIGFPMSTDSLYVNPGVAISLAQ